MVDNFQPSKSSDSKMPLMDKQSKDHKGRNKSSKETPRDPTQSSKDHRSKDPHKSSDHKSKIIQGYTR